MARPNGRPPAADVPVLRMRIAQAKRMRECGVRVADIAKEFGVSPFTVWPWLRWSGNGTLYPPKSRSTP